MLLISNTDFSILENDFLKICLIKTIISKNPGATPDPSGDVGAVCGGEWWGGGGGHVIGHSKLDFEIKLEITVFEI